MMSLMRRAWIVAAGVGVGVGLKSKYLLALRPLSKILLRHRFHFQASSSFPSCRRTERDCRSRMPNRERSHCGR